MSVLNELEVKKVIIGEQAETSEQYEKFCEIVKGKKIPTLVVKKGDIVNIEKNIKIRILFPTNELITDNILNNNSLVAKLEYKNFKMLFTGDIEEVAEQKLISMYQNDELKADVLKVPHHGSKTSSTLDFLELIEASVAVIGVGANNKFGHPNSEVLTRLKHNETQIYRTDKMGEIVIKTDGTKIKFENYVKP